MKDFVLRKWRLSDAEDIALSANNPRIAKNLRNTFPNPYSLEGAQWYVGDCISKEGSRQICRAIEVDGKAVGSVGVFVKDDVYEKSAEVGYWLAEEFWGNKITTRAVIEICNEAFFAFDIVRIYAEPFENNFASRGVLENAGFTYEGTMRNGVYKNGEILSYCVYSLLRDEIL